MCISDDEGGGGGCWTGRECNRGGVGRGTPLDCYLRGLARLVRRGLKKDCTSTEFKNTLTVYRNGVGAALPGYPGPTRLSGSFLSLLRWSFGREGREGVYDIV